MEVTGVAKKLETPEWQNETGQRVESKEEAVGETVEYEITHADHTLYVDEVGNNTCQKEDGSKGGQKFLVGGGTEPRNACSTSDAHSTTLGFTTSNGEPVLCAIIFVSETISVEEQLGIDIFAKCPNDILKFINNRGVFLRHNNNPTPFLLLDGHGFRFEVPFLSYVKNSQHRWVVCIGCPNVTSL